MVYIGETSSVEILEADWIVEIDLEIDLSE